MFGADLKNIAADRNLGPTIRGALTALVVAAGGRAGEVIPMAMARRARSERRAEMRRSRASTMPADLAPRAPAWSSDRPTWCVDLGPTLEAMATCDLWLALARGDVVPETRVWREGMPCWEPIARVPEFALALPDAKVWDTPAPAESARVPRRGAIEEPREVSAIDDERSTRPERSAVDGRTAAPAFDHVTPAPVVVEHVEEEDAPRVERRWPRIDRRGALSVVAGAALAILSLAVATSGPGPKTARPETSTPARSNGAAAAPERGAELPETLRRTEAAPELPPSSTATTRAPRGPHAPDRGQTRARASSTARAPGERAPR